MAGLDLGVRPDAWPVNLACHAIDLLMTRLPAGLSLRTVDVERERAS